jgi:hypothetical protein
VGKRYKGANRAHTREVCESATREQIELIKEESATREQLELKNERCEKAPQESK